MRKLLNLLFCCVLLSLANNYAFSQNAQTVYKEPKFRKLVTTKTPEKIKEAGQFGSKPYDEAGYYAPIRYIIVYNEILTKIDERRIEILIDEKSCNEENLAIVFQHIAKKFSSPTQLEIIAHTNLAPIETPEEKRMMRDGEDSRFKNVQDRYKVYSYSRFKDGREIFSIVMPTEELITSEIIVLKEGKKP